MAHADIERYFDQYVHWMRRDIRRELAWAKWEIRFNPRRKRGAGNLLVALGLLVYTEAIGRLRRWNFDRASFYRADGREDPESNFIAAFDRLGGGAYGTWRLDFKRQFPDTSVYEVLRSGLVHEYRPKVISRIHLGFERRLGIEDEPGGRLSFYCVPYYRHFVREAQALAADLRQHPDPSLPPAHLRVQNAIYVSSGAGPVPGASIAHVSGASLPDVDGSSGRT